MEIRELNLVDVRTNQMNIYKEQNIIELADSIREYGQLENATVYVDDTVNDGKKYTLIGGHRRFLAISYLAERGMIEPIIKASVVERPNQKQEQMMIIADNQQRVKDKETKLREISYANDYWNYLVSINQKPRLKNGERKRDWIAKKTGYGSRVVQDILTELKSELESTSNQANRNTRQTIQETDDMKLKKHFIRARKNLSSTLVLLNDDCEAKEEIYAFIAKLDGYISELEVA